MQCIKTKKNLVAVFAVIMLFGMVGSGYADRVTVKRDRIFIADGGLVVKDLHTGARHQCSAPPLLDPAGHDVTNLLSTATDVVVKRDYAVVTIHRHNEAGDPFADTVTVDVSDCFDVKTVTVDKCISTVDMQRGTMIIPCVEHNGSYLTVHMDRRGKSDNWKVSFYDNNHHMRDYRPGYYDDDYNDDHDDDRYHYHDDRGHRHYDRDDD